MNSPVVLSGFANGTTQLSPGAIEVGGAGTVIVANQRVCPVSWSCSGKWSMCETEREKDAVNPIGQLRFNLASKKKLHRFLFLQPSKGVGEMDQRAALTVMVSRRSIFVTLTSFFFFIIHHVNIDHFGFRDIGFSRVSTVVLNGTLKKKKVGDGHIS